MTGKDLRQLSEFLRELYQLRSHEEFTAHLLAALSTITEGEFTSYNEIDHRQGTGTFKADVPGFLDNPEHYGHVLGQHADSHPVLQHFENTQDRSAVTISDFVSQRDFRDTALHKEFYQPLQIPHIIGFALESRSQHSITIARHKNGRAFAERTRTILNAIRPHVLQGFQNALAVTHMQDQLTALDQALEEGQQAVLSVTTEGCIRFSTPHAQRLLSRYGFKARRGLDRLPPSLRAWLRSQIAQLQSSDDVALPIAPLTIVGKPGTLQIRIAPKGTQYLLMLQEHRPRASTDFTHLGLSTRETEILGWVVEGKTNPEIGIILGISRRTVQKHLERVYSRLGVENRHAAISLALTASRIAKTSDGSD
ncbi:MAG: helix-turn-helix transcriptional regulator [Nitrospira sp.]